MATNFMLREDCSKRLKTLCDSDHWRTAFALGFACQLLELEALNELVEAVEVWSGNKDGEVSLPDRRDY